MSLTTIGWNPSSCNCSSLNLKIRLQSNDFAPLETQTPSKAITKTNAFKLLSPPVSISLVTYFPSGHDGFDKEE